MRQRPRHRYRGLTTAVVTAAAHSTDGFGMRDLLRSCGQRLTPLPARDFALAAGCQLIAESGSPTVPDSGSLYTRNREPVESLAALSTGPFTGAVPNGSRFREP
jgi:hypothetical protein